MLATLRTADIDQLRDLARMAKVDPYDALTRVAAAPEWTAALVALNGTVLIDTAPAAWAALEAHTAKPGAADYDTRTLPWRSVFGPLRDTDWDLTSTQWEQARLLWPTFTGTVPDLVETLSNM